MTKHGEVIIPGHRNGRNRLSQKPWPFPVDKREQRVSWERWPKRQDSLSERRAMSTVQEPPTGYRGAKAQETALRGLLVRQRVSMFLLWSQVNGFIAWERKGGRHV